MERVNELVWEHCPDVLIVDNREWAIDGDWKSRRTLSGSMEISSLCGSPAPSPKAAFCYNSWWSKNYCFANETAYGAIVAPSIPLAQRMVDEQTGSWLNASY